MSYAALGSSGYYPSSWRGGMPSQSSSTNHPSGVPSYFPRPPPMPAGYAYGKRAWTSGSWVCMPEPGPGAAHGYQGRWWSNWGSKSTTKDYWSTELKDNPLDLEGMDIRAPSPPEKPVAGLEDHFLRQRDSNKPDQNRKSWIWVPALSDDSTASSSTVNNQTRHSRTRSSSQPPNERRPRSTEPPTEREQPIESAEFISASSKARPNGMRRGNSVRTQQEYRPAQVDENAPYPPLSGGEESSQNIPRYASADGYRRKRTISASRSFPQPTSSSVQPASQHRVTRESSSRLNGVQRSHTLPVELIQPQPRVPYTRDIYASVNGKRTSSDQPPPQTDRHERVNGSHDHARLVKTAYSPGVIRPPQHYESPLHSPIRERGESSYEPREGRRSDRVREWMSSNERPETKPQTRRTVDGYEHLNQTRSYDYGHNSTSHRDLQRHSSMPVTTTSSSVVAPVPVYAAQMQHSNSAGQMSDITEEPDDITGGMGRMSVGHSNSHGHGYGHRNGHIRDDVREESPLRSRSGGRRVPLERSATVPTVQEADQYVGRGSFDAHMSRRENRDREYSNEYYSPRRDRDTSPTPASRQSRPHHLHHTFTSTSPYVQRSGAGTPSRPDYMYATPERTQTHHHPYAYQSPNTKTNLGVLNTSTPRHSPLRQQVESPPHRYNSSASMTMNQPIIPPTTLARGRYADSNGFQQAPMSRAPNLERRRSSRQMDEDENESDSESDTDSEDDGRRRRTSGSGSSSESTRSQSPSPPQTRGMPTTNYPPHPHPHIQHSHVQIDQIYDTPTRRPHPHPHPHSNPRLTRTPSHPPIGAPIPPLASTPLGRYPRHVRRGFWNRRGDHLTEDSYLVYCPPGRNFPKDLEEYPDLGFKNHLGDIMALPSDSRPEEHPESIPRAGRPAARPYETFIEYVLMDR